MGCVLPFIVNAVTLMVVAGFFDGFYLEGIGAAIMASIILTLINLLIRPLLVVFTLPITVFTLGLFIFIINAALLMLTAGLMGDAFSISGFGMALLAAVIIAILNVFINNVILDMFQKK
ncbi:putative membrane protein [Alteribacillus persepolensis]|uniref:Putative membrane protein n=1 Tax=Alteribacillus persepolensis TaxID=568899 RepID=A0A1G8AI49_9BACI|nr:phage holin family protein [Alteribacillus persepolensis]SDH20642.1 putative membrane protein [Alteribacillus persepolensis]